MVCRLRVGGGGLVSGPVKIKHLALNNEQVHPARHTLSLKYKVQSLVI